MAKKKAISAPYYNIGQLRVDYWNNLKNEAAELSRCKKGSPKEQKHFDKIQDLLSDLNGVEHYFAFPGKFRLSVLKDALERKEYTALANNIASTTRKLISDSYRGHPDLVNDDDASIEEEEEKEQDKGIRKNYFEVLFVEDMSDKDEKALRHKLIELQNPSDQFMYKVVVQRSFQDALISLLFNYNIQSVVIR